MKRIILFGGSGKLGSEISAQATSHFEVIAPSRSECDITQVATVSALVKKVQPDIIINCAALVGTRECENDRDLAWTTNVVGAKNIADVCLSEGIRLIFISSAAIFDGKKGNYSEADPPSPQFYYAVTKVAAEKAVSQLKDYAIVRLDFFSPAGLKYTQVLEDHFTSKIPVNEAAEKILKIAASKYVGIINIGRKRESLYAILKPYYPNIKPIKTKDSPMPDFPWDISLNLSKWREVFE